VNAVPAAWLDEYRRMLKGPELEEPLDVFVYRPLAFMIVKALAPTRVTPNQVTVGNLLPGLAAACFFWQGTGNGLMIGAVLLFMVNVIDCVDGMLARVRGAGSMTGHILDGLADYTIQSAVLIALLHGIAVRSGDPVFTWVWGVPAGVSVAWWSSRLDRLRSEWLEHVHGRRRDPHQELGELQEQAITWRRQGIRHADRALVVIYAVYVRLWYSGSGDRLVSSTNEPVAVWIGRRRPMMRLAVLFGTSTHLTLIIATALAGRPEWYFRIALIAGTGWGLMVLGLRAAGDRWPGLLWIKGAAYASRPVGRRPGDASAPDDR
jgi:hypothetical protein